MTEEIINFISSTVKKFNYKGVVIGISGGIDSAVAAYLSVRALGSKNVFGLLMPETDSSKETLADSILICSELNIDYKVKNITSVLKKTGSYKLQPFHFLFPKKITEKYAMKKWDTLSENPFEDDLLNSGSAEFNKGVAYYRIKHRIRMCLLYLEAEKRGYAVVGTTNKTELKTGLYVKYGDDSVDIEPLYNLYKTEIYDLARDLNIPQKIIDKKPSPDLIPGLTDEKALGADYLTIDRILRKTENSGDLSGENPEVVEKIRKITENASFRDIKNIHP